MTVVTSWITVRPHYVYICLKVIFIISHFQMSHIQYLYISNIEMLLAIITDLFYMYHNDLFQMKLSGKLYPSLVQAPVPLSIFRSNSKFDENSECSSFEYTRPITTIFCTRHDSDTVVTCAKYRCDRPRIFYTRVFWIFIEFRIRSKYA